MTKCAMMSDFSISLPDRPGELARVAAMMREADVNLVGLWGYGVGQGRAKFYCVPEVGDQFRNFARSAGLVVEEGQTLYISGPDRPGSLTDYLNKIASAGINLHAIEAVRLDGEFGGFIWADAPGREALARLLT